MHIVCGREMKGFGCVIAYKFLIYLLGSRLSRGTSLRMFLGKILKFLANGHEKRLFKFIKVKSLWDYNNSS